MGTVPSRTGVGRTFGARPERDFLAMPRFYRGAHAATTTNPLWALGIVCRRRLAKKMHRGAPGETVIPNTAVLTGSMEGSRCFATREPARAARRGNTLLLPAQPQGSYPRRRQVVAGVGVAPFFIFRRFLMFFSV